MADAAVPGVDADEREGAGGRKNSVRRTPRAPANVRGPARTASSVAAVGVAVEVFAWMTRHPRHPLAKALAMPGHELQHRIATAEPSPEQLEVAEAALAACLELEHGDRAGS